MSCRIELLECCELFSDKACMYVCSDECMGLHEENSVDTKN